MPQVSAVAVPNASNAPITLFCLAKAKSLGCQEAPKFDGGFLGIKQMKAMQAADKAMLFPVCYSPEGTAGSCAKLTNWIRT